MKHKIFLTWFATSASHRGRAISDAAIYGCMPQLSCLAASVAAQLWVRLCIPYLMCWSEFILVDKSCSARHS